MRNEKIKNLDGEMVYKNDRFLDSDCPWDHWQGMPHFDPEPHLECYHEIDVIFDSPEDVKTFIELSGLDTITDKTKSTWFPDRENSGESVRYISDRTPDVMPKYPVYIVSKNRADIRLTSDTLVQDQVKHFIIVESHQFDLYQSKVDKDYVTILKLPKEFLDMYDTCDELGDSKSKGPGAARNYAYYHSIKHGYKRHWVMDDNMPIFYRLDGNKRIPCDSGAALRAMEDHTDRYSNVMVSGPNYRFLAKPQKYLPPFVLNTRIYSCLLILNDSPYRWRGRYNEDTDLSLRVLKDGFCTIQYNAFLSGKVTTQSIQGGNTDEFYSNEGTLPKSKMIEQLHPDVASVKWMNARWHHIVDYSGFKKNRLEYTGDELYYGDEYTLRIEK
ncbi:hypothetical protein POP12_148 [Pectobacterium phage POP12]|nr:hypothetical protein POP12_148 [Pectobacterium phage POP12]